MQEYLYWKTEGGKIISLGSLSSYAEELKQHAFTRIHRSYIVNINKIESVSTKFVIIKDEELPLGATYASNFRVRYKNNF